MPTKTETFYLELEEDALKFIASCADEGIEAKLLPVEEVDGRKYYPVRVTFDPTTLKKGK